MQCSVSPLVTGTGAGFEADVWVSRLGCVLRLYAGHCDPVHKKKGVERRELVATLEHVFASADIAAGDLNRLPSAEH